MDIEDLTVGRLCNVVYATIVADAGGMADRVQVRESLDGMLARAAAGPKGKRNRRAGLTPAQAAKIAADMADYDAKLAKGKVDG